VVAGPALEGQRRARGDDVQPARGVDDVGEAEQVVLVGPAAVMENEQAGRLAVGRTFPEHERAHDRLTAPAQVSSLSAWVFEPDSSTQREEAGMGNAHIGGISVGGILIIVGIILAILLGHWWIGLIVAIVGLIFFGGFARGKWY
jgi:hypothetical protein